MSKLEYCYVEISSGEYSANWVKLITLFPYFREGVVLKHSLNSRSDVGPVHIWKTHVKKNVKILTGRGKSK